MTCRASSFMPWDRRVLTAWIDCAHLLITSLTCSLADMWLVSVTPRIFNVVTLRMPGSAGGWLTRVRCFCVKIILTDFIWFKVRLLVVVHCSVFATSTFLVNAPAPTPARQIGTRKYVTPEGWKAELTLVVAYTNMQGWFSRPHRAATHPSSNHLIATQLGVEPMISRSLVRHSTVTPLSHRILSIALQHIVFIVHADTENI